MNRLKTIGATFAIISMSLLLRQTVSAHEPIFGLGPHTIYQYGYAFGTEFDKGELGWANQLELIYGLTPDWAATIFSPARATIAIAHIEDSIVATRCASTWRMASAPGSWNICNPIRCSYWKPTAR